MAVDRHDGVHGRHDDRHLVADEFGIGFNNIFVHAHATASPRIRPRVGLAVARRFGALSADGRTITVRIPVRLQRRRGRKVIVGPDGDHWSPPRPRVDSTLVKAHARAYRWKRLIESGRFASLTDLAEAEKISRSYLCRILRLTLLAPDVVEGILQGWQAETVQLKDLMRTVPVEWERQAVSVNSMPRSGAGL